MLQSSRPLLAACAAILATSLAASAHGAAPGEVDTTFGQNGRTVVAENSKAIGLRLPDGSLMVASQLTSTTADTPVVVELRRFDSEGHADPGFGVAGIARHEFADRTDLLQSVALATNGRVYFGGSTELDGRPELAVFAVNAQGDAVTNFGDEALLRYDLLGPDSTYTYVTATALTVMPDGRLLAAGITARDDGYARDFDFQDRLPQLLRFNADGSLERAIDQYQLFGYGSVCAGVTLLPRSDGSLLIGDDSGIYAFLGDVALETFGVGGGAQDENWDPYFDCTGLRSFGADRNGGLLTVSVADMQDGQPGFSLNMLQDDGTRIEGSVQAPRVPLARLVGQDAQFAGQSIYRIVMSRPVQSAADDRVYVLFGFAWRDSSAPEKAPGSGWGIVRFAPDGTLDTGWGDGGVVVLEKAGDGYWNTVPTLLESLPDGRMIAMSANGVLTRLVGGQREGHGAINIDAGRDVSEDAGQVSIDVTRTGGSAGAVSVDYSATSYGAMDDVDFSAVSGRLDWADGDSSPRAIVIPILEDTLKEDDEQFAVEVRSPSGGAVLLNTRAIVAINDDGDTTTSGGGGGGSPPPVDPSASSGGGGATDAATLILLSALIALSMARRRRKAGLPCPAARGSGHSVPGGAS